MIDFKKMDDKDFIFINKSLGDKEEKEFSDFLYFRKAKATRKHDKKKSKILHKQ